MASSETRRGTNKHSVSQKPNTPLNLLVEFLALFGPSYFLASQSINQCCGIGHLPPARLCIINKSLLVAHGLIVLGLYGIQLTLLLIQLCLGFIQLVCCLLQPSFLNNQISLQF